MKDQHPVIQLIKERYKSKSKPGERNDSFKLGLAIEGGGMRGVVSTAMASALHFLELVDTFDAVYGSSAGALAGTFFVTDKMPLGPGVYYDDINNNKFIDLKRFFSRHKYVMDLDFLIHDVLVNMKPMNWKGVIHSKIPLKIVVSSMNQLRSLYIDDYETRDELFTLLKASANIPFIAGPPVEYKNDLLFDASVYESIPFKSAMEDDCTHILVLLTRPLGKLRGKPNFIERNIIAKKMRNLKAQLADDYLIRAAEYKKEIEYLCGALLYYEDPPFDIPRLPTGKEFEDSPYVYPVFPSETEPEVKRLEKNRETLVRASIYGMKAVMEAFMGENDFRYHEVLYPVNWLELIPKFPNGE